MGTDRENIVPGKLCIMKSNVKYRQKVTFSIKNIYLYNLRYLAPLKPLNTSREML